MSLKRIENSAWTEIDELKKYADGAWTSCEFANAEKNSAWEEVWANEIAMKFGWVYSTAGVTPEYTYTPSEDGASAEFCILIPECESTARSDLVLRIKAPVEMSTTSYYVRFNLSGRSSTCDNTSYGIAVGYIDSSGDIATTENLASPYDGSKSAYVTAASYDVQYISLCIQAFGTVGEYFKGKLYNLTIDGVSYSFK